MQQVNENFLHRLIHNHHKFATAKMVMATCHTALGISCLFLMPTMLPDSAMIVPMTTLTGIVFSGLGIPTFKESFEQRQQARNLEAALPLYRVMQTTDLEISQAEKDSMQATFLELVKKTTLS